MTDAEEKKMNINRKYQLEPTATHGAVTVQQMFIIHTLSKLSVYKRKEKPSEDHQPTSTLSFVFKDALKVLVMNQCVCFRV